MANKAKEFYNSSEKSLHPPLYKSYPEKMQCHFLAKERLRLGLGSVAYLCRTFSCSPKRIYKGLHELELMRSMPTPCQVDYKRQRKVL